MAVGEASLAELGCHLERQSDGPRRVAHDALLERRLHTGFDGHQ